MSSGFNPEYVESTRIQSGGDERISEQAGKDDIEVARLQSGAVIAQAKYDFDARVRELEANLQIQMEALRVRQLEAELKHKVDSKLAQSDAIRAEASMLGAQAKQTEAESERDEVDKDFQIDLLRFGESGDRSYFYG